jgi:PAS domain S-box-containing protein
MDRTYFREEVRKAMNRRSNKSHFTRLWLAKQLFLDPKTLNKYLSDPEYGDNGRPMGFPPRFGPSVAVPHLIYLVDATTGVLLQVSDAFCEELGYAREEVIGVSSTPLLRPGEDVRETEPEIVAAILELRDGKRDRVVFDQWVRARDGRRIWMRTVATWDPMKHAWLIDGEPFEPRPIQLPLRGG